MFGEDLKTLKDNMSKFSITLFGRTMAGKSTLMEILTEGDGQAIGKGAQRTTQDVRQYKWEGLEITDVPGIGAFEGQDDERIAFNAAKTADLILFLITDDAPQASEAECFGRIMNLGKPVICILNVKASISEDKSIKFISREIEKRFDMTRLNGIKKQFMSYSKKIGQDWSQVPFIYVHLKAAFEAQHTTDKNKSEVLYNCSHIEHLIKKVLNQVQKRGRFYRLKTFIDIISNPMLDSIESLLTQSVSNSVQGRTILSKKRQISEWETVFERDGKNRIESKILEIKSMLNSEIASFSEEHFEDRNAAKAWNVMMERRGVQMLCQDLLKDLEKQCNYKLEEVTREISNELQFSATLDYGIALKTGKIIDGKKLWNWTTIIVSGVPTIGGLFISPALIPLAFGVAVIGWLGDFLFDSMEKKEYEARRRLEKKLEKNVEKTCSSLKYQMEKGLKSLIRTRINSLSFEMNRINSVVFKLADTQKELAWNLNRHYLNLNRQIVTEAIKLINADGLQCHILEVARIPGNTVLFVLNSGTVFPDKQKIQLYHLMSESVRFVYDTNNVRTFISRIIGKDIDRSKINMEDKIRIAHVPMDNVSPYLVNRIRLAQQLSGYVIMN